MRVGLNADMISDNCEVVQLHGNLKDFRCTYCTHLTAWNSISEASLTSGKFLPCPNCESNREDRRRRDARTNIHIGNLRPNIVFFRDPDDPLSERKATLIDNDSKSRPDVLLIIGTSLAISGPKHELQRRLIPAVQDNGGVVIYINNDPPPKAFLKPAIDYIFKMDCDLWVREIAARRPALWDIETEHCCLQSSCDFNFQPQLQSVEEVIKAAELELISIGDYSSFQLRFRTKEEVREDLSTFLPGRWLSTSPLMCVLSILRWNPSTYVLHSKFTDNISMQKTLKGPTWPIGQEHTRIIVPHNPGAHWILIEVDIPGRTMYYYDSMFRSIPIACLEYLEAQMKRLGEKLGKDYSIWNSPGNGVSVIFLRLWIYIC